MIAIDGSSQRALNALKTPFGSDSTTAQSIPKQKSGRRHSAFGYKYLNLSFFFLRTCLALR